MEVSALVSTRAFTILVKGANFIYLVTSGSARSAAGRGPGSLSDMFKLTAGSAAFARSPVFPASILGAGAAVHSDHDESRPT